MAILALGISGRVEVGEVLKAVASISGQPLQWHAFISGSWVNVGTTGSSTYTIPSSGVGLTYRVASTSGGLTTTSAATGPAILDSGSRVAPKLTGTDTNKTMSEGGTLSGLFSYVAFTDGDSGNYTNGSLTVMNSNALSAGGDGRDVLTIQFGTGNGQFSYNATTRDVSYTFSTNNTKVIGRIDAVAAGSGTNLKIVFTSNATKAVVDVLVDRLRFSNTDDSPLDTRVITLRVDDPTGATAQRSMLVNVTATADLPLFASPATFTADENQTLAGTVVANDPDREAGAAQGITYTLVTGSGSTDNSFFTIDAATGALRFKTAPDFEATGHSLQYAVRVRASDSNGGTREQAIVVTVRDVNEAPVAQALSGAAAENGPAINLNAAFTDPDAGNGHTVTLDTTGTAGLVTLNGQTFTYSANGAFESLRAGQTATDTFNYTVTDAGGLSSTRTATITVTGENDAPIAQQLVGTASEDGPAIALNASFSDVDAGDSHTVSLNATGTVGQVTLEGQTFTYSANGAFESLGAGQTATDTFNYTVTDAGGLSSTRTATITVTGGNDAPVAQALAGAAAENGAAIALAAVFTDADAGDSHTVTLDATGTAGLVSLNGQTFTYEANGQFESLGAGQTATDTFSFTVTDAGGLSSTRTATITVTGANDAPVAQALTGAITDGDNVWITLTPVFTDADTGDSHTTSVNDAGTTGLVWSNGQSIYYSTGFGFEYLGAGETAVDTFSYTVTDAGGLGSTRTASITVTGINDAPQLPPPLLGGTVIEAATLGDGSVDPGTPTASGTLAAFDQDSNDTLTFGGSTVSEYGQFTIDSATGAWTYTLDNTRWQTDSLKGNASPTREYFNVTATDSQGATAQTLVMIDIAGRDDAPTIMGELNATAYEFYANTGKVELDISPTMARDVLVDAAGRILVYGQEDGYGALMRFLPNGAPDATFGYEGKVPVVGYGHQQLAADAAGNVFLSGYQYTDYQSTYVDFSVRKFNADGSLDMGAGDRAPPWWTLPTSTTTAPTSCSATAARSSSRARRSRADPARSWPSPA